MKVLLAILFLIVSIGCSGITKTVYIKPDIPELPAKPGYYSVEFQKNGGLYCVDEGNAKNLLKNREVDKGYQEELRTIIEGLQ